MDTKNLSISEQLTYCTVRIEGKTKEGNTSVGTGFFYDFNQFEGKSIPAVVTNKHVIENIEEGGFLLNLLDANDDLDFVDHKQVIINDFENQWISHPDPNIDLCVMPIAPIVNLANTHGNKMFYVKLENSLLPTDQELEDLTAIEEIIMVGYPAGIWDSHNNKPIIRKGITATHPSLNYEGRPEFLIDAACFPGSSGSPVFLYNMGNYTNRKGGTIIGNRFKFLGIMYAGPQYTSTGEIEIVTIPTADKLVSKSNIPINLGNVIKSPKLLDFEPILDKLAATSK